MMFLSLVYLPANWAQESDPSEEGDAFELNPFVVTSSDDRGYLSPTAVSATSLKSLIRDLPISMDVVNEQLIADLQANDMKEALSYTSGIFQESFANTTAANSEFASRDRSPSSFASPNANPLATGLIIRGYNVPNQQREGFRIGAIVPAYGVVLGGSTDAVNTERLEVVRGPASLLYGINVLSGIVNVIPKRPLDVPRYAVSATVGNYDYLRSTFEATGPLIRDRLNYRFAAAYTQQGDWTDYLEDETQYYALQFDWKITPTTSLFLEGQYSNFRRSGGGTQFFQDGGGSLNTLEFFNKYDEYYTFGRDFFNEDTFTDPTYADKGREIAFPDPNDPSQKIYYYQEDSALGKPYLIPRPGNTYEFPDLGPGARLSGPDVFQEQKEFDFLALASFRPFDGFNIQLGAYYTHSELLQRDVVMSVINNADGTIGEKAALRLNPEADPNDELWFGFGEVFVGPDIRPFAARPFTDPDLKYATYFWQETPTETDSIQLRARGAYEFDTDLLDGKLPISHTLISGVNYIKDEVEFVTGGTQGPNVYSYEQGNESVNRFADDPYHFRNIFDYSVIRYNGDALAIPGYLTTNQLTGIDAKSDYIVQSGWRRADLWYKGKFVAYHGKALHDRLNLVAGLRWDAYQVEEAEYLRVVDRERVTDQWLGSGTEAGIFPILPQLVGVGDRPYQWREDLPDSINAGVEASIEKLRLERPEGTVSRNFDDDQKFTTKFYGLNFRIFDPLSIFYVHSEGIFPNTGQRDGAYRPIEAEQSKNDEIGIKFEFLDGKISGSVGLFRLHRENAVWNWPSAPNPQAWVGGPLGPGPNATDRDFDPQQIRDDRDSDKPLVDRTTIRYTVNQKYVVEAFEEAGLEIPVDRRGNPLLTELQQYGVVVISKQDTQNPEQPPGTRETYYSVDYETMKSIPNNPFTAAMDAAIRDKEALTLPFIYFGSKDQAFSASNRAYGNNTNVLFEEEGTGLDANIIFSPISNYQLLLSFSHQKREVTGSGFTLVPGYQVDELGERVGDETWTTEYDVWVYQLGPENFEDPTDPTTLKGSAVNGLDLSHVPQYSARLWNKYTFVEGPLKGLSLAGGVRWNSSITTADAVGGEELASNRYLTPDIPARTIVDLALGYRCELWERDWTFSLKIDNLLNDREVDEVIEYPVEGQDSIYRRTHRYYQPMTFRLSARVDF